MVYSYATNGQMPAQPAAPSDPATNDANVYHLVGVEGEGYETSGAKNTGCNILLLEAYCIMS